MSNSTTPASAANERDQQAFEAIADKYEISIEPAYGATKVSGVTLPYKYAHTTHLFNIFMEGIQAARAIPQPAAEPATGEAMNLHEWARIEMRQAGTVLTNLADSRHLMIDGGELELLQRRLDSLNRALIETGLFRVPGAVLAKTGTSTDSAADAMDAERYRWLRKEGAIKGVIDWGALGVGYHDCAAMNAAIDAAIAAMQPKGPEA